MGKLLKKHRILLSEIGFQAAESLVSSDILTIATNAFLAKASDTSQSSINQAKKQEQL